MGPGQGQANGAWPGPAWSFCKQSLDVATSSLSACARVSKRRRTQSPRSTTSRRGSCPTLIYWILLVAIRLFRHVLSIHPICLAAKVGSRFCIAADIQGPISIPSVLLAAAQSCALLPKYGSAMPTTARTFFRALIIPSSDCCRDVVISGCKILTGGALRSWNAVAVGMHHLPFLSPSRSTGCYVIVPCDWWSVVNATKVVVRQEPSGSLWIIGRPCWWLGWSLRWCLRSPISECLQNGSMCFNFLCQ